MSQTYEACVVVGLPYNKVKEFEDLIDEGTLETFPPYYDAPLRDCICGLKFASSDEYSFSEFKWNEDTINSLKDEFKDLTGKDAQVWITPASY